MNPFSSTDSGGKKHRLAIFASGNGSNAQRLMEHFRDHPTIIIALVVCNKPGAGVLARADAFGVPTLLIERERFFRGDAYRPELEAAGITFLVLAGFLWKVPAPLLEAYPGRIVNIHPALLPAYGGKGMWGQHVHAAVLAAGESESGITIHIVDEHYDHGDQLFQARCPVLPGDTPESLAARVHELEHRHFAEVVERAVREREA
ncbi:phosphoribosylglycinamide formyltransferase [Flaviaesturariibacter aridisoli]|uniref:Phosphoribosylglycinamide formyltransferase n=1 Tax=Flaviaesturariibacter aridisoli TaxID=2545761 RepID=A0A4R4E1V5_9BACT|nr:phosphoribosylglycinamide formyltransferase [Flaviaesturariibacter aridisoli]TCZ72817.1 phosphoribosylglycinamide formyltransferase [Flaviaesturariibacter aridisoli]